jgi:predicted aspartyl protease
MGSFIAPRAIWLCLACFLSLSGNEATAQQIELAGYERVQMSRGPQNHLLLPAAVNGRPATFLLDTGADVSFLRADRADEFGVRSLGREARSSGRLFALGAVDDLRIGNLRVGSSNFALYRASQLRGHIPGREGKPADGVIGLDILRRQRAVINCRTRHAFFKADAVSHSTLAAATRAMGLTRIPMTANRRGYLTVPCSIRGRKGRLVVDTGAFVTGLDDDAARSLNLVRRPSRLTARGFDGRVRALELAQVDDMRIGGIPIAPQQLAVIDIFGKRRERRAYTGLGRIEYYAPLNVPREGPIYGLLGNELLDQRHVIIDLDSMSLFLK